jgi:arylsulfatase A-like enzyme
MLSHVDVAPTLLSLCGIPAPPAMQGADLAPVLLAQASEGPDSVYFQIFVPFAGDGTPHPWRGVRTGDAMYARTQAGPWVLYDLEKDPFERSNLADDPAHAALRERMEQKLAGWMTRTGDSWGVNSMEPVEDKGRLYRFGTFYTIDEYVRWAAEHPDLAPRD